MKLSSIFNLRFTWVVLLTFSLVAAAPPQSGAALVESRTADGQSLSQRAQDLESVRSALEHELVVQRLADYGYTQEEAQQKLEKASDEQLHQIASLSDNLAAGADGLGFLVTALVIVLLVVLILKVSDRQVIIR